MKHEENKDTINRKNNIFLIIYINIKFLIQ